MLIAQSNFKEGFFWFGLKKKFGNLFRAFVGVNGDILKFSLLLNDA
jgi:hypothetical protein